MERKMYYIFNHVNGMYLKDDLSWIDRLENSVLKLFHSEEDAELFLYEEFSQTRVRHLVGRENECEVYSIDVFENCYILYVSELSKDEKNYLFEHWDVHQDEFVLEVAYCDTNGYFITFEKKHEKQIKMPIGYHHSLYYL